MLYPTAGCCVGLSRSYPNCRSLSLSLAQPQALSLYSLMGWWNIFCKILLYSCFWP